MPVYRLLARLQNSAYLPYIGTMLGTPSAQFEIAIDGTPRTCRDTREHAMEAGRLLKNKYPLSQVTVRDMRTDQKLVVTSGAKVEVITARGVRP
jgi:hypothetical protein